MMTEIRVEFGKLRGSLALLLLFLTPALPALLVALGMATSSRRPAWSSLTAGFVLPLWSMFLLPMSLAAVTTLMAQIEYRGRSWDHLLTLPVPRATIFAAKTVVALCASFCMTLLATAFALSAAGVVGTATASPPAGSVGLVGATAATAIVAVASLPLVAIQLWIAMRFANFVVPLAVGIGGTLVGLAASMTRSDHVDWFPWVLPAKALASHDPSLIVGAAVASLILLVAMNVDLTRATLR